MSDMERDGDVVSLGLAPRFREGLCLCQRLLIHHTSCGPGSDTLQCLPNPPPSLRSALSCMCAHLSRHSLIPVFTLLFSLSVSVRAFSSALGKMDRPFYSRHVFIHAPHPALLTRVCLSLSLSLPILPASLTCGSVS